MGDISWTEDPGSLRRLPSVHLEIRSETEIVTDTTLVGGGGDDATADPGLYTYTVVSESDDTVGAASMSRSVSRCFRSQRFLSRHLAVRVAC